MNYISYNICFIGNFLSTYGHTLQICEALADKFEKNNWQVYRGGKRKSKWQRLIHMISTLLINRKKVDVVIIDTFSGAAFIWAYLSGTLAWLLKIPYIPILHGGHLPEFSNRYKKFTQTYLTRASHIVTPSKFLHSHFKNLYTPIHIIPNPIHISKYTFKTRENFKPNIFWLRRFHSIYNPQLAILVLSELLKTKPDAHLTMAGPDSGELDNCVALANHLNINKSVKFLPSLTKTEISQQAQRHDFFLNTSNVDNAPVTLVEAAIMGLPIISTNVGGISHLFENQRHALLIPPNNPKAMAIAIISILQSPSIGQALTSRARLLVKQMDWSITRGQWEKILRGITYP